MPDPAWPSCTPETNYLRLVGPGAAGTATTIANGVAWQALMGSHELAFSLSTLNTAVTTLNFEGVGGLPGGARDDVVGDTEQGDETKLHMAQFAERRAEIDEADDALFLAHWQQES